MLNLRNVGSIISFILTCFKVVCKSPGRTLQVILFWVGAFVKWDPRRPQIDLKMVSAAEVRSFDDLQIHADSDLRH